jgi:ribosome recycling factor
MPVNQVANVVILDNHTLKIEPWDKTIVAMIEKAIYDAETGLAPQGMGDYLLVKVPALTTERRQQIAKQLSSYGEDTKISLRQVRQDARDNIRSLADDDEISEDQQHIYEEQIDTMIKMYNEKVDTLIKAKEDDIMSV